MNVMRTIENNGHTAFLCRFVLLAVLIISPVTAWSAASIADPEISNHVESELLFDPAVPFNSVDVNTEKGIVTLSGTVSNLLARERARRIAETVRGVRSVVNLIDVDPILDRSGQSLTKAVNDALFYDPAADSYEIMVKANDKGQVTLNGTVESWQERELTETVAKGVSGITRIENNIVVRTKLDRPDAEIAPEIRKRLRWDTLVDDALIDVQVEDGKVVLSGIVGSLAEKSRTELDSWVAGVKAVDSSELKVEKWTRDEDLRTQKYVQRSDLDIREAIEDALLYDPRVYTFNLDVAVTGGIVTLQGVVDNVRAKKAAEQDARNTVGVIGVDSLIKVRPVTTMNDDKIADNVRNALMRYSVTESYEIDVNVKNQVAHLNGTVDSNFEKAEAENVALHAKGVIDVKNNLTVSYPDVVIHDPYVYGWSIYNYPWYQVPLPGVHLNDWEIKRNIENELLWSPFVDSEDINVAVEGGIATLTGTVDSIQENNAAKENAFEGGATGVINKLNVRAVSS